MIAGERHEMCKNCYIKEDSGLWSGRMHANREFQQHYEGMMAQTHEDGTVGEMKLRLMDIRFSNVCNFKCRSCGPQLSSLWYKDTMKLYPGYDGTMINRPTKDPEDMWRQMLEHIDHVEEIYFAGGEPLITEEHYRVLKELDQRGHHHVRLIYNTNFSQMTYKDLDVMKIWNKFETVRVGASLDAPHARGEYMRKGQDWKQTVANRERMMEVCPGVNLFVSCTLSLMNAWVITDFIEEWLDKGYIGGDSGFHINPLIRPEYFRTQVLPRELKDAVAERYERIIQLFENEDTKQIVATNALPGGLKGALSLMYAEDHSDLIPKMLDYTRKLDKIRGEDFFEVFPEWESLRDYRQESTNERSD